MNNFLINEVSVFAAKLQFLLLLGRKFHFVAKKNQEKKKVWIN